MELETKVLSREIQELLFENGSTLGTAESCTGGRVAEALVSVAGASQYFKGGIVAYSNEIKINLLKVSDQVLEEKTAVCEDVAKQMVVGACETLRTDFAISTTGVAGPTGGTHEIPVGSIWIGYGSKDDVRAVLLTENYGRDINLAIATNKALRLFLEYYKEKYSSVQSE